MILVSVFFLITSVCMFREIEAKSGQVGVRFTREVIGGKQLDDLYEQSEEADRPRVTLWKQTEDVSVFYEELGREVSLKLVDVWGDVEQIYPECLSAGAPLIKADEAGCMLSEQAAYRLFGGTDVVGMRVVLEGKKYIIRGLIDIREDVLVRENGETSYTCIEAEGRPREGAEKLRQMLMSAGVLLDDGAVVEADTFCGVLRLIWMLPVLLLVYGGYRTAKLACQSHRLWVWGLRAVVVVLVVILLRHSWGFSEDFIPSKWSDFEFFSSLLKAQWENYRRYLDVAEVYKDRILFEWFKRMLIWDGVFLNLPRPKLTFALSLFNYPIRKSIISHPSEFIRLYNSV